MVFFKYVNLMFFKLGYLYLLYLGDMGGGGVWFFMKWLCLNLGYIIVCVICKDEFVCLYYYFEIDYVSFVVFV